MKIVNIIGGLGNQMFQYALAIALQHKYTNEQIKIDISHFNRYRLHNGYELGRIFGVSIPISSYKELLKVTYYVPWYKVSRCIRRVLPQRSTEFIEKRDYVYDNSVFSVKGDCYFEGYWQSSKYFNNCKGDILKAFTFPDISDQDNLRIMDSLKSSSSVSMHIRRGDYVNAVNYQGICDKDYYLRAIEEVKKRIENPSFFIFSNDIIWCENNIRPLIKDNPMTFVVHNTGNNSYKDMQLMSLSRACIIANSSFSWWAAYLNKREDRIIIAPKRWVNHCESEDIYVNTWLKI